MESVDAGRLLHFVSSLAASSLQSTCFFHRPCLLAHTKMQYERAEAEDAGPDLRAWLRSAKVLIVDSGRRQYQQIRAEAHFGAARVFAAATSVAIAEALCRASRRGVDVWFVVDGSTTRDSQWSSGLVTQLKDSGSRAGGS